jgi:tetratricopeptide (TPR) repeat protein
VARGAAFEAKRLVPRAIDDYTRAIKSSKAPVPYFMRANAYMGIGDIAAAIKDYTSAIDKNNDFAAAYQHRAAAHERMGRADLAQADQQMAARLAAAAGQANQAA